jgi:hypothetical protein
MTERRFELGDVRYVRHDVRWGSRGRFDGGQISSLDTAGKRACWVIDRQSELENRRWMGAMLLLGKRLLAAGFRELGITLRAMR